MTVYRNAHAASLRSAADRRNPQNTVTEFPVLHTEKVCQTCPGKLFQPISVFVFQSLRDFVTVKFSQTESYSPPESYRIHL